MQDETPATPATGVTNTLSICLNRKTVPVHVTKTDGTLVEYTLKEMTGLERDGWLNGMAGRMEKGADGKATGAIKEFGNMQASLIGLCLYDDKDNKVPLSRIAEFPATVQAALYGACQDLNSVVEGKQAGKNA